MYLAWVPDQMAHVLGTLVGSEYTSLIAAAAEMARDEQSRSRAGDADIKEWENHLVDVISSNSTLPETQRTAVIEARVGQGMFRGNVARIETCCRVTKVHEPVHLRASHVKPWRSSTNDERLNGENGLLLTPTVDHLFDRGFISFEDRGDLLVSPIAHLPSLRRMGIDPGTPMNVGGFSTGQREFLSYHRENVFLARTA